MITMSESSNSNTVSNKTVGRLDLRVRYVECDPMGVAHHTVYPVWFEMGRTELLRDSGLNYRDFEAQGIFLAVIEMSVKYRRPARYDDALILETSIAEISHVKIMHSYVLYRDDERLATAATTLACLDREGRPRPIPDTIAGHQ
jgi:acyl-CoA thioester hydrolase